jgi:hypothetical protein
LQGTTTSGQQQEQLLRLVQGKEEADVREAHMEQETQVEEEEAQVEAHVEQAAHVEQEAPEE